MMTRRNVTLGRRIASVVASASLVWGLLPAPAIAEGMDKAMGGEEPPVIAESEADEPQPEELWAISESSTDEGSVSVVGDANSEDSPTKEEQPEGVVASIEEAAADEADDPSAVEDRTENLTLAEQASTSGTWGTCAWELDDAGNLTIHAGKGVDSTGEWLMWFPWSSHIDSIKSVVFEDGVILPKDCSSMFREGCYITTIRGLSGCDASAVTTTSEMFSSCSLKVLDGISDWDVSSLVKADYMFGWCRLSSLDLSGWKTSSLRDASYMFVNSKFTSLNVSGWDTSGMKNMSGMFDGCSSLTSLDVSDWDVSSATNMSEMFSGCSSLTSLDLSAWDTSSARNLNGMFRYCSSLTSLDCISDWNVSSVTSLGDSDYEEGMFQGCTALTSLDLSKWNTSSVKDLGSLFCDCSSLAALDVSSWDTSHVTSMAGVFTNCSSLVSLDLSSWDTSSVTNLDGFHSKDVFQNCKSLARIKVGRKYKMFAYSEVNVINKYSTFPDATNVDGWWSETDKRWYTKAEIVSSRAGIADTYTNDGIPKPANPMVAKATKSSVTVTYRQDARIVTSANVSVTDAAGALTYTNASTDAAPKGFSVNKTTGRVTLPFATPAGTYAMKVRVTAAGNAQYKKGSKTVSYKIVVAKAANPVTVTKFLDSISVTYKPTSSTTTSPNVLVDGPVVGAVTYSNVSTDAVSQTFIVNKTTGKVTVRKATRAGTYTVKVKATAAGDENHKSGSKTASYKIVVKKATNPITVKAVARTASYATLRTKAVTVTKPLTVSGSIGTKTYARAQNSNYFTVNKSDGKVTIKKGTPKGTYSLKIKVTAAGGPNYKSGSKTVTCKVTVK